MEVSSHGSAVSWKSTNIIPVVCCLEGLYTTPNTWLVAPEPEGSPPYSQEPATGPYPEPSESTSQNPDNM
jgi:hypothetical protein